MGIKMSNLFSEELHKYYVDGEEVPSVTEIAKPISFEQMSKLDNNILERARNRGSIVHEYCEQYLLCGEIDFAEVGSEYIDYVEQFVNWYITYKPKVLFTEYQMYSSEFAGTTDLICEIDGKRIIVDYKTTSSIDTKSLSVQLEGYRRLAEMQGIHIDATYSLQLKKDSWTFKERDCDSEWFDLLLKHNKKMKGE